MATPVTEARTQRCVVEAHLQIEKRAESDESRMLVGHAALFDLTTDIGNVKHWGWREKVARGAFSKSLARGDDVRALFNHDPNIVLGRSKAGTLRLREDERGLAVEIDPPDTQAGRDLVTSVGRGDISQMSISFIARTEEWSKGEDGVETRTLVDVDLLDVSPVTFPAFEETEIGLRSEAASDLVVAPARAFAEAQRRKLKLRLAEL